MVGAVLARGLQLIAFVFVARKLGKVAFGELGIIQSTIGMFGTFAGLGLGLTATKHVAEFRYKDPRRAGHIIALSSLIALASSALACVAAFLSSNWLAIHALKAQHLSGTLRLSSLMLFFLAVAGAQTGVLGGFEAFRSIATVNLVGGLGSFPILVAGVHWFGLTGAVGGLICSQAAYCVLNQIAIRKQARLSGVPIHTRGCGEEWSVIWRFSLPAMLSSAIVGPINWACSIILVNRPTGYAEMGVFSVANQWRLAVLFVPITIGAIVLPLLSSLRAQNEHMLYQQVLKINVLFNGSITFLMVIPVAVLSPYIMTAYGSSFTKGWPVLVLLGLTAILMSINNVIGQAIASQGKMWIGFLFNALWAASIVLCALVLVPRNGAIGLASANLIAYSLHSGWQFIYLLHLRSKIAAFSPTEAGPQTASMLRIS